MSSIKSVSLYFTDSKSDKVYNLSLDQSGIGYLVNFSYGPRGGVLKHGSKTAAPLPLEAAEKVYAKVYAEKTGKGYTEGESGKAFLNTENAGRYTGILPQLLNAIALDEAMSLMGRPGWCLQEKMDGERAMLMIGVDGTLTMTNRKGLSVPVPEAIAALSAKVSALGESLHLDGELIGDQFHAFDILRVTDTNLAIKPFSQRYSHLAERCEWLERLVDGECPVSLVVAHTGNEMLTRFHEIKSANKEGVVFRFDAPYTVGRPNSGGDTLKFKFVKHATVRVTQVNEGKRSVGIEVVDGAGVWLDVGNVTIPPNKAIPAAGDLIEVLYLYRASEKGSLFQPVFVRARTDLDVGAANESQLVVKAAA